MATTVTSHIYLTEYCVIMIAIKVKKKKKKKNSKNIMTTLYYRLIFLKIGTYMFFSDLLNVFVVKELRKPKVGSIFAKKYWMLARDREVHGRDG